MTKEVLLEESALLNSAVEGCLAPVSLSKVLKSGSIIFSFVGVTASDSGCCFILLDFSLINNFLKL